MTEKTIAILQDLIRINIDSYRGFQKAAETIESESIAKLFRQIAGDRRRHAGQLRDRVAMTDEEAEDSGSIKGTVHRWWLTARGTLNGGDDHVVLIEAERGEDAIKARYEESLESVDDPGIEHLLKEQYAEVKRGHDMVRDLRDLVGSST